MVWSQAAVRFKKYLSEREGFLEEAQRVEGGRLSKRAKGQGRLGVGQAMLLRV